jgi:hypothetical protein
LGGRMRHFYCMDGMRAYYNQFQCWSSWQLKITP